MLKKILIVILAMIMVLLPASVQAGKDYIAERFDVDVIIYPSGSMQVTETIAFRFMGGPFTYAFRHLEKTFTDGITFTSASLDGVPLPVNGENALEWVEVEEGDPLAVTWHFAPTTNTTRIYQLTYRVDGVVRKNATDQIVWMVIPQEHEYRIQESRITVTYPRDIEVMTQPQLSGSSGIPIISGGNPLTITTGPVMVDVPVVMTLNFPPGSLITRAPNWQIAEASQAERTAQTAPYLIGGAIIGLFALIAILIITATRQDPTEGSVAPVSAARPVSPPTDYKPGVAAALAARANPTLLHSLATLIDLAQRGFLSIDQLPGKLLNPNIFELVRIPNNQTLSPHEQVLMDAIFTRRGEPVERMRLDQYATQVGKRIGEFSKAVKLEIGVLGLISPARKKKQTRLLIGGTGLILVGLVLGIALIAVIFGRSTLLALSTDRLMNAILGVSIAAFISGLTYIIYTSFFSPLTSQGRWIAGQWNGFSAYLRDIIRQREEPTRPDAFFQFLPFATGFGLGAQWAKSFQKRGYSDVPAWFHALNAQDAASSFNAFAIFMASSNTNASASGGAAGGVSGGGASGAG